MRYSAWAQAKGMAEPEGRPLYRPALGDVVGVPDLLGDHAAVAGERLHGPQQPDRLVTAA